jgi:isopenicillin N synthase-like dioxygenase
MSNIPVIDIQAWRHGDERQQAALAATLDLALQESGFLLVENHGVASDLTADIRAAARQFFRLPPELKARYATTVGGRGWVAPGREANAFYGEVADTTRADLKESYTIGREFATGDDEIDRAWFASNVWPAEVPELAHLCTRYTDAVRVLYIDLLQMCAVSLGLARDWFVDHARFSPHAFNINRYPPMTETGPPLAGQFRIAPHTDWGVITILDRQPGYGGLQVQRLDGEWEDAPYQEGAFTVNIGDLMARWTGDRWRSTRHRVLPPSAEAPREELVSLILFLEANSDTVIESFPPPIGRTRGYAPVTAASYLLERTNAATVPAG